MKTMKLFLFTTLALLISANFNAVQAQEDTGSNQMLMEGGGAFLVTTGKKNKDAIGTPYLYKDFALAIISSNTAKVYNVRYNAYADEIEIKIGEGQIQNFNKGLSNVFITFVKDDVQYTSLNYTDTDDNLLRGYFITLTESNQNVKLFTKKGIRLAEAQPAISGYDKDKPAEFKATADVHFITIKGAYAFELPSKRKDIAKLFPDHSKTILDFIKKNKIKTSREGDLIELINYINSI
jgi:hypothetical protein